MTMIEYLGLVLLVVVILLVVLVAVRRSVLVRSGAVDLCWRSDLNRPGVGWVLGQARFRGDVLQLFRSLSPLPAPSRSIDRYQLTLGALRDPVGAEPDLLPAGSVIVRCTYVGRPLELAMGEQTLTGLRSWLESAPTGAGRMSNDQ